MADMFNKCARSRGARATPLPSSWGACASDQRARLRTSLAAAGWLTNASRSASQSTGSRISLSASRPASTAACTNTGVRTKRCRTSCRSRCRRVAPAGRCERPPSSSSARSTLALPAFQVPEAEWSWAASLVLHSCASRDCAATRSRADPSDFGSLSARIRGPPVASDHDSSPQCQGACSMRRRY